MADPERRRILHEDGNEAHRVRVEHDRSRLYVELSGEDGAGRWTVLAVDRASRQYAVAQAGTKTAATEAAARALTALLPLIKARRQRWSTRCPVTAPRVGNAAAGVDVTDAGACSRRPGEVEGDVEGGVVRVDLSNHQVVAWMHFLDADTV